MNSVLDLLQELRAAGVQPRLDNGQLKLVGATTKIDAEFLKRLKSQKNELVEFLQKSEEKSAYVAIEVIESQGRYPVSNAQKRLWVLNQFDGGAAAYNIVAEMHVKGEIVLDNFSKAFQQFVDNHESLRTTFHVHEGAPFQVVADVLDFEIETTSMPNGSEPIAYLKAERELAANKLFDLETGPLLRVQLISFAPKEYMLLLTVHHIVSDGWSMGVMIKEVVQNYEDLCKQLPVKAQKPAIQYKDYSAWLNNNLSDDRGSAAQDFWSETFKDEQDPIDLPTDKTRPEVRSFAGNVVRSYFTESEHLQIQDFCASEGLTLFNFLQSNLYLFLHLISKQSVQTIGTPVSGRNHFDLEQQFGLYVNTLALRGQIQPDEPYVDFVKRVQAKTIRAFEYQHYPFDLLIEQLELERDAARNPLFDVMLVLQNIAVGDGSLDFSQCHGFEMRPFEKYLEEQNAQFEQSRPAKFDLSFIFAHDLDKRFYLDLEYTEALFGKQRIEQFTTLLKRVVFDSIAKKNITPSERSLVSEVEKTQILTAFNRPIKHVEEASVPAMLAEAFESKSVEVAIRSAAEVWTYEKLDEVSNQIACYFQQRKLANVSFLIDRTPWTIALVVGALKAGVAYVPIDKKYPQHRIDFILNDIEPDIIVVQALGDIQLSADAEKNSLSLETLQDALSSVDTTLNNLGDYRENIAYYIFTSGSTGTPKGVEICHRNLIAFLKWAIQEFASTPYEVMFAATSYCFDLSIFEMLLPLLQGKSIRILPSALAIEEYMLQDENVFINTVPSVVRTLLDQKKSFRNVVALNMAGEQVPTIFRSELDYNKMEVRNLYGPSEDTTYSTVYRFKDDHTGVPIGRPVGDTQLYILDKAHRLQPIGLDGEIYLSGESVALGYHNRKDLTDENFVENPFVPGHRMYRTGDMGRWLPDGQVSFVGRIDDQIKLRGYRIELGEIQHCLEQHEAVTQAAVLVKSIGGDQFIVAFWEGDKSAAESDLAVALTNLLPEYMVPTHWCHLDEIPLNHNGKVDKRALLRIDLDHSEQLDIVAPTNERQQQLLTMWEQLLETSNIGIQHNFFKIGGHSLKAIRLVSMVQTEMGLDLRLEAIFQHPTIEGIDRALENAEQITVGKIERISTNEEGNYPLSLAQERLWVLTSFENASAAYHMPAAFVVQGEVDVEVFNAAILQVIDRHESLRTVFLEVNDEPVQHIMPEGQLDFAIEQFELDAADDAAIHNFVLHKWKRPFDFTNGPLLRAFFLTASSGQTILSFNMHHMISDGWSIQVLYSEVMHIYAALKQGVAPSLASLDLQYKDYAEWQKIELSDQRLAQLQSFWKEQLSGELSPLQLPTSFARPAVKTYNGSSTVATLEPAILVALKQVAVENEASLFMALLAALNVLFKKYSGQNDIVIGTPVAGRNNSQLENQIGFFVNTLPLRTRVNQDDTFLDLLEQQKQNLLNAFDHQTYPFERMVEDAQLTRDMSRTPLFDVAIVLQNTELGAVNADTGFSLSQLELPLKSTKYDLTFSFAESDKGLLLNLEYNSDLYDETLAQQMIGHLRNLMLSLTSQPSVPFSTVSVMDVKEQGEVFAALDFTKVDYDTKDTILARFKRISLQFPERIAVQDGTGSLTYEELDHRAGQLAKLLVEKGVQAEDLIVLHFDRNISLMVGVLGTLKAGACYVPVDPSYPESRINYIIEDSQAKLVLGDVALSTEIQARSENITCLDYAQIVFEGAGYEADVTPNQLAYVIYTSGTTGNPKGVLIEHRNVVRLIDNEAFQFDFSERDTWTLFHSYCFDFSVWEMYGALLYGARLLIVEKSVAQDATVFYDLLRDEKVTVLNQTPTAFRSLEQQNAGRFAAETLAIRYLVFGGEALMPETLKTWSAAFPDCTIVNMYGITETTVHVTYKEITAQEIETNKSNIGTPIPTLGIYLLDADLQAVPANVTGEIYVGGDGVARGYLRREELTAERFIANPYKAGDRLYKSGDYARLLANGDLEYIGRKDFQVKIRGHRIELSEIESALLQQPSVKDAVVIPILDEVDGHELVAYYLPKEEADGALLRINLTRALPTYMVPTYFVALSEFPVNSNGKLDKTKLPKPQKAIGANTAFIEASSDLELQLVEIWKEVLDVENVGLNDDFFELGGHSLKATRLLSQYRKQFQCDFGLQALFENVTINSHIALLAAGTEVAYEQIKPVAQQEDYPVSDAQRRLWVLSKFQSGALAYNIPAAFTMKGELNSDAFCQAFFDVVNKHEILRTVFLENEAGDVRQKVQDADMSLHGLQFLDLSSDAEREHVAEQAVADQLQHQFDLTAGPLLKASLLKQTETAYTLLVNMHHVISDGWSMGVLTKDVLGRYEALCAGHAAPLDPLRIQYKDYTNWRQEQLSGTALEMHKRWWHNHFSGELPILNLPTYQSRPKVKTYKGTSIDLQVTNDSIQQLKAYSKANGGTLFIGLLTVFNAVLSRYAGQSDLVVGTPVAGRTDSDLEEQIGFYINTLAIRTAIANNDSFEELFNRVTAATLQAYDHQIYPFDRLVEELALERDTTRSPLFDVMLVLQNMGNIHGAGIDGGDNLQFEARALDQGVAKFDLSLTCIENAGGLNLNFEYNSDLFTGVFIKQFADSFVAALDAALRSPEVSVGDMVVASKAQEEILLREYNQPIEVVEADSLVQLLAERFAVHVGETALFYGEQAMSYEDLWEASDRLASYLIEKHRLRTGDRVALVLDRSPAILISILAVLKTGAAYVPIDPKYPQDRIAFMLDDVDARTVLVDTVGEACLEGLDTRNVTNIVAAFEEIKYSTAPLPKLGNMQEELAYLIYTSGSTGKPKGVEICHRNTLSFLCWAENEFAETPYETLYACTSYCFDISVFELIFPLVQGKSIRLLGSGLDIIDQLQYDTKVLINTVPSVVRTLLEQNCDFDNVVALNMAGEAVPSAFRDSLDYHKMEVRNLYGPSEDTTFSTVYRFADDHKEIPIGKPVGDTHIFILDDQARILPLGVEGEICLSGEQIAKGYLNRQELTNEKFIDNPFGGERKLYRTGDIGKWLPDRQLVYTGRKDDQVKLRGFRIELGEIQYQLEQVDGLSQALVVVREVRSEQHLVAYYESADELAESILRQKLSEKLPAYMVPQYFHFMRSFPLSNSGKIDRKALPNPVDVMEDEREIVAARNETEELLVQIWQEVLDVAPIGVTDDFFHLGGHSLKATQVLTRIHNATGLKIDLENLFFSPTIEHLSKYIETVNWVGNDMDVEAANSEELII
jgi:amino acid adenylation domain-containing protein